MRHDPRVTIRDSGRQRPSALRWTLLVNPPRERPRPHFLHHLHQAGDEALPRLFGLAFYTLAPFEAGAGGGSVRAPAACWWARTMVESTEMSQSISPASSAAA